MPPSSTPCAGPWPTAPTTRKATTPPSKRRSKLWRWRRELAIDPDLDRAQELVYDTIRATDRPDLAALAEALNLSPALFESKPEDEVRTSA